jgi:DNA-binding transcriptional regulator YiaG
MGNPAPDIVILALTRALIRSGEARRLRVRHGLSLSEVGASIDVAATVIAKWERGETRPTTEHTLAYGELLSKLIALDQRGGVR